MQEQGRVEAKYGALERPLPPAAVELRTNTKPRPIYLASIMLATLLAKSGVLGAYK